MSESSQGDALGKFVPRGGRARLLVLIGVLLYVVIVWYIGWRNVGEQLLSADLALVATTVALIFTGNWVRAAKWRYALGPGHDAFAIFFLSKASAEWSPGRLGEFSPMVIRKHRTPKIGAWLVLDRIVEMAVTLVLGLAGLAWLRLVPVPVYAAILAACAVSGVGVLYAVTQREFFLRLAGRLTPDSWPNKFAMLFAAIGHELFLFVPRLPLSIVMTAAPKCTDIYAIVLLFRAFGQSAGFMLVAAAKCALAIVSFIPITPLATGLPHMTQAGLMHYAANIPSEVLAAAIGVEVAIVSVSLWSSLGLAGLLIRK